MSIPFETISMAAAEILKEGFAKKITLFTIGEMAWPYWKNLAIVTEPSAICRIVANKIRCSTGVDAYAAIDEKAASDWLEKRPSLIKKIEVADNQNECLIISKDGHDVALLFLEMDGICSARLVEDRRLSLGFDSIPYAGKELLEWLVSFLPSDAIIHGLARKDGQKFDTKGMRSLQNQAEIFRFFRCFGNMLPGCINFRKPDSPIPNSEYTPTQLAKIDYAMPKFARSPGFPPIVFPNQAHGFPVEWRFNRIWDCGKGSSHYFLPLVSYGNKKTANRILSILAARKMAIPTVEMCWIKYEKAHGLALERFDILGGKCIWRENMNVGSGFSDAISKLDLRNIDIMCRQIALQIKLGVAIPEIVFIEPMPNGECLMVAPFTGIGRFFQQKESIPLPERITEKVEKYLPYAEHALDHAKAAVLDKLHASGHNVGKYDFQDALIEYAAAGSKL